MMDQIDGDDEPEMERKDPDEKVHLDAKQQVAMSVLAKVAGSAFSKPYHGDLFGTRTDSIDGMLYLSRITVKDQLKNNIPTTLHAAPVDTALPKHADTPAQHINEVGYRKKKRQCAKTFERMVYSRLTPPSATPEFGSPTHTKDKGMKALLDNGIVPALVSLAAVPDSQTQLHCARAFYGLAQVPCTRRLLVLNGVVNTIALLVRHAGDSSQSTSSSGRTRLKQDLAAILGHISEESFLEDKMLREGVDRILVKLYQGHNAETKRIVALTFFNLSHNAAQIKHFIDSFTQCITAICKTVAVPTHPNKATLLLVKALFNLTQVQSFHNALMAESAHRLLSTPLAHFCKCHKTKTKPVEPVEEDAIEFGLKGLFMLASTKNGRLHIVQDNLISSIVACLALGGTIADVVCSLLYQLSLDETCREPLAHEMQGVVDGIIHCSTYGYFTISWVLRHLCATRAIFPTLVACGVVPLLMQMARDTNSEIKLNGISCMCCLFQCDLPDAANCVDRIIGGLVQLLQSNVESITVFAITALYNLSCNDTLLPLLCATNIVDALKPLFTKPDKVSTALLPLIYQLSSVTRSRMLEVGYFDPIAAAISSTTGSARHAALDTMLHFTVEPTAFPQGTDEVKSLVKTLYTLKTNADNTALRSCVSILAHLTTTPKNRDMLLRTGVTVYLARVCNAVDDFVMTNCAYILFCLTEALDAVEIIVREEAIPVLIHLSRASNDYVKELCILSFCRISSHPTMEAKLVEQGAIAASMIMALVATKSDQIKTLCVKIISNCLCVQSKHCTRTMVDHGVFWALSSLSTLPFSDTKHACATCFCNLSTSYPLKMVEAGVPRALVQLVETGDGPTIVVALEAIANLLSNEKACGILVNEGLVKVLQCLVDDSNANVAHAAARAMLRISRSDDRCRVDNLQNGLLQWILSVMSDDTLATQALITLCDSTASAIAKEHIRPLPALSILRAALHATDQARRGLCMQTLYNMTCQPTSLLELIHAEAHVFVQHLFDGNDDPILATLGVISLYNLTCVEDEGALSNLVTSGLTAVLHHIYLFDTATDKTWCVLAVCNLALGKVNSSRIVSENGGVVLIDFVQKANPEVAATIAAAFRKLINPPGNQKMMVDLGVVASFVYLLRHHAANYPLSRLRCLDALAILTRNNENVWRSLHDGLLPCMLDIVDENEAQTPPDPSVGALCFNVLSNICAVDFDSVPQSNVHANVIAYLTQLSEYSAIQESGGVSLQPTHHKANVEAKHLTALPPIVSASPLVTPMYAVPWEKCYAENQPVLPAPIGIIWSPVNISVFTKNLPDSFKLPRFEILEKEVLIRDYNDTSEAAHRYVVGIKGLVRMHVRAHAQSKLGTRRKKLQSFTDDVPELGDKTARPLRGKSRKESTSLETSLVALSPIIPKTRRSSSLKYVVTD
ncbi:hypothetical protein AC1031_003977 [Aphanomyces cochlioides]|nr:hypothetical protein AC1031_003977 [Aphanomyces cochlioides]